MTEIGPNEMCFITAILKIKCPSSTNAKYREPFKMYTTACKDIHETGYWSTNSRSKFCSKSAKLKVTGVVKCFFHQL